MPYEFLAKNGLISQGNITATGSLTVTQNISASRTGSFGAVAIGTNNLQDSLTIGSSISESLLIQNNTYNNLSNGIQITTHLGFLNAASPNLNFARWTGASYTDFAGVGQSSGPASYDLQFVSGRQNTGSAINYFTASAVRMTVKAVTGHVGIGTTNPSSRLHISDTSTTSITMTDDSLYTNSITNDNSVMTYTVDTGNAAAGSAAHVFKRYNSEFVRINSVGNVGIGTSSPDSLLHVYSTLFEPTIRLTSTSGSVKTYGLVVSPFWATSSFHIYDFTADVTRIHISSTGNVGINVGANTPTAKLQIGTNSISATTNNSTNVRIGQSNAAAAVYGLALANTATATVNNESALSFIVAGDYSATGIISTVLRNTTTAASDLVFTNYNSGLNERMRIQYDGNVGIGSTSPQFLLDVNGSSRHGISSTNVHQFTGSVKVNGSLTSTQLAEKRVTFTPQSGSTTGSPAWYRIISGSGVADYGRVRMSANFDNSRSDLEFIYGVRNYDTDGAGAFINITRASTYNSLFNAVRVIETGNLAEPYAIDVLIGNYVGIGSPDTITCLYESQFIGAVLDTPFFVSASATGSNIVKTVYTTYTSGYPRIGPVYSDGLAVATYQGQLSVGYRGNYAYNTPSTYNYALLVSGSVGIGTSSPSSKLHVVTTATNDGIILDGSTNPLFAHRTSGTDRTYLATITSAGSFFTDASNYDFIIRSQTSNILLGRGSGSSTLAIVGSSVGINTTSPVTKLDVRSGYITAGTGTSTSGTVIIGGYYGDGNLTILGTEFSSGGPMLGYGVTPSTGSTGAFFSSTGQNVYRSAYIHDGGTHRWYTGPVQTVAIGNPVTMTEKMRMDVNGNVGIGTTTLAGKLTVTADQSVYNNDVAQLVLNGATSGSRRLIVGYNTATDKGFIQATNTLDNYKDLLLNPNGGNVGIGTTTPGSKLEIIFPTNPSTDNGAGNNVLRVWTSASFAADVGGAIGLGGTYNTASYQSFGQIAGRKTNATANNNAGYLQFGTTNATGTMTEQMRIDNAGRVGIGTSSPSFLLDVSGSSRHGFAPSNIHQFTGSVNISGSVNANSVTTTTQVGGSSGTFLSYVTPGIYSTGTSTGNAIGIFSNTTFANQGAIANLGLHQVTANANDLTAGVYLSVGGWYQNSGTGLPVYIGGGYTLNSSSVLSVVPSDSSGNGKVGIGTRSPSTQLHVVGSSLLANPTAIDPDSYQYYTVAGAIADGSGWGVNSAIGGNSGLGDSWAIGHNGESLYMAAGNGSANNTLQTFLQVSGSRNLFLVPTSGKVGIGMLTPTSSLDVNGDIKASSSTINVYGDLNSLRGNVSTFGYNLTGSPSGTGWISVNTYHNSLSSGDQLFQLAYDQYNQQKLFTRYSADSGATWSSWKTIINSDALSGTINYIPKFTGTNSIGNSVIYDSGGNVGIATTAPGAPLDVIGQTGTAILRTTTAISTSYAGLRIYNNLNVGTRSLEIDYAGSSYAGSLLTNGPTGESACVTTTGAYPLVLGTSNTARMTILSGGNVGIGTITPNSKLEVAGASGTAVISIFNTTAGRSGSFGIDSNGVYIQNSNNGDYFDLKNATGTSRFRLIYDSNTYINTTYTSVGSLSSSGSKLSVFGNLSVGSTYGSSAASTNGAIIEGNVGIGTTAANARLNVASTSQTTKAIIQSVSAAAGLGGYLAFNPGGDSTYSKVAIGVYDNYYSSFNRGNIAFMINSVADATEVGFADTKMFISASGNVGIGLTNPAHRLDVFAPTTALSGQPGIVARFTQEVDGRTLIRVVNSNASPSAAATHAGISFVAYSNVSNQPSANSHEAQIMLGGTGTGTNDLKFIAPQGMTFWVSASNVIMTGSNYVNYGTQAIAVTAGGNVGIGTPSPAAKVEISGSANSVLLNVKSPVSGNIVYVTGSGAVGINTTTPAYTLQVNGSFAATTKSFVIDHPTKPNKKLVYGSLESPYHGIRLTGRDTLVDGKCVVELPDYISKLVLSETVNIQLTGIKCNKVLYVDEINIKENNFTVAYDKGVFESYKDYDFFWDFTAIRADVPKLQTEI